MKFSNPATRFTQLATVTVVNWRDYGVEEETEAEVLAAIGGLRRLAAHLGVEVDDLCPVIGELGVLPTLPDNGEDIVEEVRGLFPRLRSALAGADWKDLFDVVDEVDQGLLALEVGRFPRTASCLREEVEHFVMVETRGFCPRKAQAFAALRAAFGDVGGAAPLWGLLEYLHAADMDLPPEPAPAWLDELLARPNPLATPPAWLADPRLTAAAYAEHGIAMPAWLAAGIRAEQSRIELEEADWDRHLRRVAMEAEGVDSTPEEAEEEVGKKGEAYPPDATLGEVFHLAAEKRRVRGNPTW
jgi:hypothetical protein